MRQPQNTTMASILTWETLTVRIGAGVDMSMAIQQGARLAFDVGTTVRFDFNGTPVEIDPKMFAGMIQKAYDAARQKQRATEKLTGQPVQEDTD